MTARVEHHLFLIVLERLRNMQADVTNLTKAVADLRAETTAAVARVTTAHQGAVADTQARVDALTADVAAATDAMRGIEATPAPTDAPAPLVPVVVPFAPGTEGDPALILRSALPGANSRV